MSSPASRRFRAVERSCPVSRCTRFCQRLCVFVAGYHRYSQVEFTGERSQVFVQIDGGILECREYQCLAVTSPV